MKKLIRLNAAIVASLVSSQPLLFAYHAKAQSTIKPNVYSIDQWASGAKPSTTVAQPTTGAAKPITGTWTRNSLSFVGGNFGCGRGEQPVERLLKLSEQAGLISVEDKANGPNQGGRLTGNQFSLKDSANGFTFDYVGTLNAARNEISGTVTCRYAVGRTTSTQNFTLKLQPATIPQVIFTPSAIRETSPDSYQVDLVSQNGKKAIVHYRRLNGKVYQEEIHQIQVNPVNGSSQITSKTKFSADGNQAEIQIPNSKESISVRYNSDQAMTITTTDKLGNKKTYITAPDSNSLSNQIEFPTLLCDKIDAFCKGAQRISNRMLLPNLPISLMTDGKNLPVHKEFKSALALASLGCWILKGGLPPIPKLQGFPEFFYGLAVMIADEKNIKFPFIEVGLAKLRKKWGLDFCDKDSITVTIQGPTTLKEGQSTIVRVEYQSPMCLASEVTIYGPISYSRVNLPTTSSCSGKVDFKVFPKKGSSSGGCRLHENTFAAFVPRVTPGKVISPPVTVSRHPGQFDYSPCYAEITK